MPVALAASDVIIGSDVAATSDVSEVSVRLAMAVVVADLVVDCHVRGRKSSM